MPRVRTPLWQYVRILSWRLRRRASRSWLSVCESASAREALGRAVHVGTHAVVLFEDHRPRRVRAVLVGRRIFRSHFVALALLVRRHDPGALVWMLRRMWHYFPSVTLCVPPRFVPTLRRWGYAVRDANSRRRLVCMVRSVGRRL